MRKVLYLFSKLSDGDVDWLLGAGKPMRFEPGNVVVREGERLDALDITLAGSFDVSKADNLVATIGPGELVGELSFLDSRPPLATVQARESSVLLRVSAKRLSSKLRVDDGFAARFYLSLGLILADRMRQTVTTMALGDKPVDLDGADTGDDGEIGQALLDEMSLAGARFDRLRQAALSAESAVYADSSA